MLTPDRSAAPDAAPRPGAAEHATPPAEAGGPFAEWCRRLTPADVIASTLMATTRDELGVCIRAWMHVYGPAGWATADVTEMVPDWWPPGYGRRRRPRTFPELVSAVRRQLTQQMTPVATPTQLRPGPVPLTNESETERSMT